MPKSRRRPKAISSDDFSENDFLLVNPGGQVLRVSSGKHKIIDISDGNDSPGGSPCGSSSDGENGSPIVQTPGRAKRIATIASSPFENSSVLFETLSETSPPTKKSLKRQSEIPSSSRKRLKKCADIIKPTTPLTRPGRRTRSSTTGIEYTPADLISSPSQSSDSDSVQLIKQKKKRTSNRVQSDTDAIYSSSDHQILESQNNITSDDGDIPVIFQKQMLYCIYCGQDKPLDDFSTREQTNPRNKKGPFCLLHTHASGKATRNDYKESLDEKLDTRKREVDGLDRFDGDWRGLKDEKYDDLDGFLVGDDEPEI
jgi:hypothetical protein